VSELERHYYDIRHARSNRERVRRASNASQRVYILFTVDDYKHDSAIRVAGRKRKTLHPRRKECLAIQQ
jgi:hypothetical protein